MRNFFNIAMILTTVFVSTFAFAGNNDKGKALKAPAVATYDVAPVMDKAVCDVKLKFDLALDGMNVSFANKSEGTYTDVEWSFGDGEVSKEANATYTYEKAGTYYFTASLYNASTGCMDFVAGNIYVSADKAEKVVTQADVNNASIINLK